MALQIIELGVVPVVTRKDPDWLKKLFGSFPSAIDLALCRFPDHKEWPEFDPTKTYDVAWFEGETFANWAAVDKRLTEEDFGPDRRTYPLHLATEVVPRCDELWRKCQDGKGPRWIYASSAKSFWRHSVGDLCLPCVHVSPGDRRVRARWVECGFRDGDGFLVPRE